MKRASISSDTLDSLADIPSLLWLFETTETEQQQWAKLRRFNEVLSSLLKAYFAGNPPPELPKESREFYSRWMDYYLAFYDVLFWGWKPVEAWLKEAGLTSSVGSTPSQVLEKHFVFVALMHLDMVDEPYFAISRKRMVKLLKIHDEAQDGCSDAKRELQSRGKEVFPPTTQILWLPDAIKNVCMRAIHEAEPGDEAFLSSKLSALDRKTKKLIDFGKKSWDGIAYSKGKRLYPSNSGGAWK